MKSHRFLLMLTLLAIPLVGSADPKSDGQVWAALFLATGEGETADGVPMADRLEKAFSEWSKFEVLGENTQPILTEYESWVVPTKEVFLKIDSLGPAKGGKGLRLNLQLWQAKNVLVKTDTILRNDPLFIAGPDWGDGRLIMVVALQSPDA